MRFLCENLTIILNKKGRKTEFFLSCKSHMAGSVLMMEETEISTGDLLLQDIDFPPNYVHMAHPDDYKPSETPIPLSCLRHENLGHCRLILRVSFRLNDDTYIPVSFVCDTGAPSSFYLSEPARNALSGGRLHVDELGNLYINDVLSKNAACKETPPNHQPGNLIGLRMLERLGMTLHEGGVSFKKAFAFL